MSAIQAWDFTALLLEQQVNVTGNDYKHLSDAEELPMMIYMNNVGHHKKVCSIWEPSSSLLTSSFISKIPALFLFK